MNGERFSLESLLAPMSPDTFFERHWGQAHTVIKAENGAAAGRALMDFRDLDRYLALAAGSEKQKLTLIPPAGKGLPQTNHRVGDVPVQRLYALFGDGFTLRIFDVQDDWEPVGHLVRDLEQRLGFEVDVNLYATPAGSQGFAVHTDDEEVMVVQVDGSKEWFVYDPVFALPVESHQYLAEQGLMAPPPLVEKELTLRQQLHLCTGDFLYIPRGFPHRARATAEASLHLTIAIHPLCWSDLLKAAVEEVTGRTPKLRQALPLGYHETMPTDPESQLRTLLELVTDQVSGQAAWATLADAAQRRFTFPPDGHFAFLAEPVELTTDTVVRRRQGVHCRLRSDDATVKIAFGSNHLRGPKGIARAVEFISSQRTFRVGDLPGLDEASKTVFARRLIKEGLLQPVEADVAS